MTVQADDDSPAPLDLRALAGRIAAPDEGSRKATSALLDPLAGALGRLGDIACWLAAVQGACPPRPFHRIRIMMVETEPALPRTAADHFGLTALATPADPADAEAALTAGISAADAEIDAGADLLALTGGADDIPARAVVALLAGADVASVIGHPPGTDDRDWMRTCAAVRDTARRGRGVTTDMVNVLSATAAAELATYTGVVVQAAVRRTPVLLDGLVATVAAVVAQRLSFRATRWFAVAHRAADPAQNAAVDRLRLDPMLDYGLATASAVGAVLAAEHLQVAAGIVPERETRDRQRIKP